MRTLFKLIAGTLIALSVGSANAAKSSPTQAGLLPGGQTIAGPGAINNLLPGEQTLLFFFQGFAEGGLDICATLVNTGKNNVKLEFFGDSGSSLLIEPGRTQVLCESDVDNGAATCQEGGRPCSFLWRVDEVRSGS
ncbi:MAG: hypothetical protein ABFS02_13020 [Pseudomonadota bacterium]